MHGRSVAVVGALALVAGACGGPYYDACDPSYDPYYCYDPWGYCDAYGCYGLAARTAPTALTAASASASSGDRAAQRALATMLGAAEAVRRLTAQGSGSAGEGTTGPVDLGPDSAPGVPAATYRLVLDHGAGEDRWQLQAKPIGAGDDRYRAVFTGATLPGPAGHDAQGLFGLDLDALAKVGGGAGGGQVLGSFADRGQEQATAYRLLSFRPGEGPAYPDAVLTDTGSAPGDAPSSQVAPPASVAPGARASATTSAGATLAPPAPPTSMPGVSP